MISWLSSIGAAARDAGRLDVAEQVAILDHAVDHVAVHHLHVIDVERQLHVRRADLAGDVGHVVDVVALVARMSRNGCESSRVLSCSTQIVTPFFSACAASFVSPATQFAAPSSSEISPLFGSSASRHL